MALNENAQKWVAALRSGEYKQCAGMLTKLDGDKVIGHCCLGVACEVAIANGVELKVEDCETRRIYNDDDAVLPDPVVEWLGLTSRDGAYNEDGQLTADNDAGQPFDRIADIIESESEKLFA
jgi:hypothetical protein